MVRFRGLVAHRWHCVGGDGWGGVRGRGSGEGFFLFKIFTSFLLTK